VDTNVVPRAGDLREQHVDGLAKKPPSSRGVGVQLDDEEGL
jgi:hypothetical protein